ncbi:lipoyl(octanoyl) transferase LipB [Aliidiomarina sanyensis]|uniref:Octanoyltransferase n=1 Tax=Aliidiomarina sanyensis TaxID=1249555 RepID=A0A432WEY7_9GAMM|nr:lipoyl(octanoyl) transferase LipB [Aliidiomarina sanyensis]RUO31390.1 octanoyltransferase [Aliidiomarina sanyensis]
MHKLVIRQLHDMPYEPVWRSMQAFTDARDEHALDELWIVEHPPVFTQGQAGKAEHLLAPGDIPVVPVDRGGQVTYHGPGQLVVYFLLDIRRRKIGVRELVTAIESSIVDVLKSYGIESAPRADAPGVYIGEEKVCSVGLRIRRGCSFHGLAMNVNMDLSPFLRINPCGYAGMVMTQTSAHGGPTSVKEAADKVVAAFAQQLNYTELDATTGLPEAYV